MPDLPPTQPHTSTPAGLVAPIPAPPPPPRTPTWISVLALLSLGVATLLPVLPVVLLVYLFWLLVVVGVGAPLLLDANGLTSAHFFPSFILGGLLFLVPMWIPRWFRKKPLPSGDGGQSPPSSPPRVSSSWSWPEYCFGGCLLLAAGFLMHWGEGRFGWEVPDVLHAGLVIAGMLYFLSLAATLVISVLRWLLEALVRGTRRSPFVAGFVLAGGGVLFLGAVFTTVVALATAKAVGEALNEAAPEQMASLRAALATSETPAAKAPSSGKLDGLRRYLAQIGIEARRSSEAELPSRFARLGYLTPNLPLACPRIRPSRQVALSVTPRAPLYPAESPEAEQRRFDCFQSLGGGTISSSPVAQATASLRRGYRLDPADAEDIAYTTMISVCLTYARYDIRNLAAYYNTSIQRRSDTAFKRAGRFVACTVEDLEGPDHCSRWRGMSGAESALLLEEIGRSAWCSMKDDQRQVLLMGLKDFSYEEIARSLGKSEPAVRQIHCRAMARLREAVERSGCQ